MLPVFIVNIICFFVGFLYPSYSTFKAVKSKNANHIHQWAIYWICYSVYCLLEKFLDILFYFWMPFYNEFKVGLIVMMTSNQASGSMLLYKTFIERHLLENEDKIDVGILRVKQEGLRLFHFLCQHATVFINKIKTQAVVQLQVAATNLIKEGLFSNQTVRNSSTDTVDSVMAQDEQFTIIEKAGPEFYVTQSIKMNNDEEVEDEEIAQMLKNEPLKRTRGRARKKK